MRKYLKRREGEREEMGWTRRGQHEQSLRALDLKAKKLKYERNSLTSLWSTSDLYHLIVNSSFSSLVHSLIDLIDDRERRDCQLK